MAVDNAVSDVAPRSIPWPSATLAWWTVACIVLAAFICTMDRFVLNILVGPIRSDLGITDVQFSLLQGVSFTVINSAAVIPLGLLTDKTSRRNLLIFGIFVWSFATTLGGFSHSYGEFLTARVFVGMGEAALWPVAVSIIADLLPQDKRGRAVGLVLMGQILGGGASLILTGYILKLAPSGFFNILPIIGHLTPWRLIMALWGSLGAIVIAMLLTAREPVRRATHRAASNATSFSAYARHIGQNKSLMIPIYISATCIAICSYSNAAWIPAFYIRHFHVSPGEIAPILGYMSILTGTVGSLAAGLLSDRAERSGLKTRKFLIPLSAAILCVPGSFLVFMPTVMSGIVLQGVTNIFYPIVAVVTTVIVLDLVPNEMRGKAQAVLTLFSSIGATLGPTLTSMATEYIYKDDTLVGYSLLTVLIPALTITASCFYFARKASIKKRANAANIELSPSALTA